MTNKTNTDIQILKERLSLQGADFELIPHATPIRSKSDAEKYFNIEETAPTLILKTEKGYFALIVSGKREKVDFKALKKLLRCKNLRLANKKEIQEKFNLQPGQIPLVGHEFPTIIDNMLFEFDYVYGGCGDVLRTLKIKPQHLVEANRVTLFFD